MLSSIEILGVLRIEMWNWINLLPRKQHKQNFKTSNILNLLRYVRSFIPKCSAEFRNYMIARVTHKTQFICITHEGREVGFSVKFLQSLTERPFNSNFYWTQPPISNVESRRICNLNPLFFHPLPKNLTPTSPLLSLPQKRPRSKWTKWKKLRKSYF